MRVTTVEEPTYSPPPFATPSNTPYPATTPWSQWTLPAAAVSSDAAILAQAAQLSTTRDSGSRDMAQASLDPAPGYDRATGIPGFSRGAIATAFESAFQKSLNEQLTPEQQSLTKQPSLNRKIPPGYYKSNELWPSDSGTSDSGTQPQSGGWLDVLFGIAKAAPGGIKTYYDIQTQNQAVKALRPAKAPKTAPMSMQAPKSTRLTPYLIGGLALLVLGGGAALIVKGKKSSPPTKKK